MSAAGRADVLIAQGAAEPSPGSPAERVRAHGKFLFAGPAKLYVRGTTYGTFSPGPSGDHYPNDDVVGLDFAAIKANGLNALRVYTVPPRRILDAAWQHGLRILVGVPWEQHVAFLEERRRARAIEQTVRDGVRACLGHPAILGYAVGNEIPAPIVRWHGARRIQRFLHRLYLAAKETDSGALVTYVSYPTTEYLDLPFLDFVSFNVYLERQLRLRAYLAHLHHLAGERPLVMTEIGLDSRRNGTQAQARALDWQIRTAFAAGCAGAFVFAWTDEWHRGDAEVLDWDFGLVDRERRPKPALAAVRQAFTDVPFHPVVPWPSVSVIVCTRNGARTIRGCCEGLRALEYPDFEVVVIDDGSTDDSAAIAAEFGFRVVSTENHGLSQARNLGLSVARGEIVAYIDDDAAPDPDWLTFMAATFMSVPHAAVGGPNITPPEDGRIAACVAKSPGGPIHVLLSDLDAEHIPGCNMAFRKEALTAIGEFDPQFRAAGDDVDVCWRLQDAGHTLAFCPAAVVWHHRRNSVRAYWRQQQGYGHAEALLERKWPERYNVSGHLTWAGRLYTDHPSMGWRRGRVYQGVWGSSPFQSLYHREPGFLWSLPAMPEWYLGTGMLAVLSALGALWSPLWWAIPLLALAIGVPLAQAVLGGMRAWHADRRTSRAEGLRLRAVTIALHVIQPLARLRGRLRAGLTPWRRRGTGPLALPLRRSWTVWSERWREPIAWVAMLDQAIRDLGGLVRSGGEYDRWDLQIRFGTLGAARARTSVEEHGQGRQLVRIRVWPHAFAAPAAVVVVFGALAAIAALDGAVAASAVLGVLAAAPLAGVLRDAGLATAALHRAVVRLRSEAEG